MRFVLRTLSSVLASVVACSVACAEQPIEEVFPGPICAIHFSESPMTGTVSNVGPPSDQALTLINKITAIAGINRTFDIYTADIERYATAFATMKNGNKVIVYDRGQRGWSNSDQPNVSDVFTMAHEVGHHVGSHTYGGLNYTGYEKELEADRFAGYALARMGFTVQQVTRRFWDYPGTQWHPGGLARKEAAREGWEMGRQLMEEERGQCKERLINEPVDVDGTLCRVVEVCREDGPLQRLSCQDYDGNWVWK